MDTLRATLVRKAMAESGLDAIICRLAENVLFLTGYWPRNGFSFLVFPREADPTLIVPEGEVTWAEQSGLKDIRTFGWGQVKDSDPYEAIAGHLEAIASVPAKARIGYEGRFEIVSPSHVAGDVHTVSDVSRSLFQQSFPSARFSDATDMLNELRALKTPYEVDRIRIANEIACLGLKAFRDNIRPGLTEAQIAATVAATIQGQGVGYKGVSSVWAWPYVMSGLNTVVSHRPYLISTTKPLAEGDLVMIELGVVAEGYWSDTTRTHVVGAANQQQTAAFDAVMAAHDAAIAALKPGVRVTEVDAAARGLLTAHGFGEYFVHHTGHGLGFRYHEPIPFLHPAGKGTVEPGMITSIEPGVYIPGFGGIRVEDNVVVRNGDAEILSIADPSLEV